MAFSDWFPSIAPRPLRGPNGRAYFGKIGEQLDAEISDLLQRVLARFPGKIARPGSGPAGELPHDSVLEQIGRDRQLPRWTAIAETSAAYSARLLAAWKQWAGDDTPITGTGGPAGHYIPMLRELKGAGFPTGASGAHIVQYNGRFARFDGSDNLVTGELMTCANRPDLQGALNPHSGWTFDARDLHWASFGIVFPADVVGLEDTAGNAKKAALNAIVRKWRPAKALYRGAWVVQSGRAWGWPITETWGAGNWGSNTIRFISPG